MSMSDKSVAQLRAEYESALRKSFEEELNNPDRVKKSVEKTVLTGVGALMGLCWDDFHYKWEIRWNNRSAPFQSLLGELIQEVIEEHRDELKATVKEIFASKGFMTEVKREYRFTVQRDIQKTLSDLAAIEASREALRIIGAENVGSDE